MTHYCCPGGWDHPGRFPESAPLPEGVFHLLIADDDLAQQPLESHVMTICGELTRVSSLPPTCFPPGEEIDRDPRYCPACVREAARWNAETRPVDR